MRGGIALLALALLATGCREADRVPRNLILISIDTLRADHLGCYGHPLPTSPNLDAFAAEGVLFEDAYATSPWTLPSHLSLLTGRYPTRHGVSTRGRALAPSVPTLAAALSQHGFRTAAIVNATFMRPKYGMARGFRDYEVIEENQSRVGAAPRITDQAIQWLREHRGSRVFLFLHYFDVHSDYASLPHYERIFAPMKGRFDGSTLQLVQVALGNLSIKKADAAHLARLYDAGIRQLDDQLARLFAAVKDGWLEPTVVIVTSDHGEEFLEHGGVLHTRTHYQELLHVPLILRGPTLPPGVRVATPVSLIDVVPTALTLLDLPPQPGLDGADLAPLWRTPEVRFPRRVLFAEAGPQMERDGMRSVRDERYKLIVSLGGKRRQLYDLTEDPSERHNLVEGRPEALAELDRALEKFMDLERQPAVEAPKLSPEQEERLRRLGYL